MNPLPVLLLCILLAACGGKKQPPGAATGDTGEKPPAYIPFVNMLRDDLKYIDSTPLLLNKYMKTGASTELESVAGREEVKALAAIFMEPDFNKAEVKTAFTETTYADKTTGTVTFNYEPVKPGQAVKKVFLNFSSNSAGVFSLRWASLQREHGDTLVNLYWKKGSYFLVGKSWPAAGGGRTETTTRVVWDESYTPENPAIPATDAAGKATPAAEKK